jgi:hypothetical protein
MNSADELFRDKNEAKFYVPIGMSKDKTDGLVVELLDALNAYLFPLAYSLGKWDLYDYVTSPLYVNMDMLTYLRHKKYLCDESEFTNIFIKYYEVSNDDLFVECYEVRIKLDAASADAINETELSDVIVSLSCGMVPTNFPTNIEIKKAYYIAQKSRFSYIAPA